MQIFCIITAKNDGTRVPIELSAGATTPTQLRQQVATATKIPLAQLRLIFRGKMIKDEDSKSAVEVYKLEPDCVLHCMGKPAEEAVSPTPAAASVVSSLSMPVAASSGSSSTSGDSPAAVVVAAPAPAASFSTASATNGPPTIAAAMLRLRQNNPPSVYHTALTTLDKILNNIVSHPMEDNYRTVKRQNPAFSKRLGGLVGGHDCMLAVGFKVEFDNGTENYQLYASAEQWPKLVQAKADVGAAAKQAEQRQQLPAVANNNNNSPFGGAIAAPPGGGGLPRMPPMLDPAMSASLSEMMSNPEALRGFLQNPMMQEIMRSNPNISPLMRQQMEAISSNPGMIDQLSRQMQNPAMRAHMEAMMAAGRPGDGGIGGFNAMGSARLPQRPPSQQQTGQPQQQPQSNDQDQTEEDMIAEAIRRSLEEN